jgi:UPF0755 protein
VNDRWREDPWDARAAWERDAYEPAPGGWRPSRRVVAPVALAVAVAIVGAAIGGVWWLRQLNPRGEAAVATAFEVREGDDLASVSERLEAEGFVTSARAFRWYVARRGGLELVPGTYAIVARSHVGDVQRALGTTPEMRYVDVTFPEGFTVAQIARRLAEATGRLTEAEVLDAARDPGVVSDLAPGDRGPLAAAVSPAEGLLFPDTYEVSGSQDAAQVLQRLADQMSAVAAQEGLAESRARVGVDPYEVLIVASLVEREAKLEADRARIARVIYNRLERGMELQIDASLYYGAPEGASFADLKAADGPYNTYRRRGLPPTPIANPGRAAIRAAMNPAPNPPLSDPMCAGIRRAANCAYLYYVLADAEGGHAFAATYEAHQRNVEAARAAGLLP